MPQPPLVPEKLLHETFLVNLEDFELVALGGDPVVEG
jgi:hypothetical protein